MPDPVTGVTAGATVIGAGMQSSAANKATRAAEKASAEQLAFAQQQYDDWQQVYGPIQDNLSNYYSQLSPEYYEAVGIENYEQELQNTLQQLETSLVQRGIDPSSGIAASLESQAKLAAAEEKAGIRRDAPRMAAEDKGRFLQIGMGSDPSSSMASVLTQRSQSLGSIAQSQQEAAGQAMGTAIKEIGTGLGEYLEKN